METGITYDDLMSGGGIVTSCFKGLVRQSAGISEELRNFMGMAESYIHGLDHWVRVGMYSLAIASHMRKSAKPSTGYLRRKGELENAVLFASFFHDCMRVTEGTEPGHGREANRAWLRFCDMSGIDTAMKKAVTQALLFHEDHEPVDPRANHVTICLCNADRLDRVRLGQDPIPTLMYDDGVWKELTAHSNRLLKEVRLEDVRREVLGRAKGA